MATLSLSLSGNTIGQILSGFSINDTDALRILAWAIATTEIDDNGISRAPTPVEAIDSVARNALNLMLEEVRIYERREATMIAEASVTPISATVLAP